jgi:hypothetical protein
MEERAIRLKTNVAHVAGKRMAKMDHIEYGACTVRYNEDGGWYTN